MKFNKLKLTYLNKIFEEYKNLMLNNSNLEHFKPVTISKSNLSFS